VTGPAVCAVVVAYLDEPWLERCVESLLASAAVQVEVVLVDNGDTSGGVDRLAGRDRVRVVRPGRNLGFAGGCNAGAAAGGGDVLALVNPDAVVEPDALARLAAAVEDRQVGIATASIRLAADPSRLNSVGNPLHYLGLVWAGGFGEPAADHGEVRDVATASGAGCALRRELWDRLGGFDQAYFAYHEDTEISLRCWQQGLRVVYVPDAVVVHRYEFSRNKRKNYLLERNRWLTVLTLYSGRSLLLLLPPLLALEVCMLAAATAEGWLPEKVAGYRWLVGHAAQIRRRRSLTQAQRRYSDRELAGLFATRFEPANLPTPRGLGFLNFVLERYWQLVRGHL